MFVYETDGAVCITFKDNKPVTTPEYTIITDKVAGTLTINGTLIDPVTEAEPEVTMVEDEEVVDEGVDTTEEEESDAE